MKKRLNILMAVANILCLLFLVLGETHCFPCGVFSTADTQQTEYLLNLTAVAHTLLCVPLAVRWQQKHHAIPSLLLLTASCNYSTLCYYLTLKITGLLCAAIAYLTLWYIYATTIRHHRQL